MIVQALILLLKLKTREYNKQIKKIARRKEEMKMELSMELLPDLLEIQMKLTRVNIDPCD